MRPYLGFPSLHQGIRIDKIPIGGAAGLLFALGAMTIFLIGVPLTRWFLIFAVPAGVIVAGLMRLTSRVWVGVVLTVLIVGICLIEFPAIRWLLACTVPLGIGIALIRWMVRPN